MNSIYIISPIIGGIIGYFTNWIAIKMLFRPYKKLSFGPFTLPFTPGLIPKERARIAESIATAVGDNLLNPQFLAQEAVTPDKTEAIKEFLTNKRAELQASEWTIEDILERIFKETKEEKLADLATVLAKKLTSKSFLDQYLCPLLASVSENLAGYLVENTILKERIKSSLLDSILDEQKQLIDLLPADVLDLLSEFALRAAKIIINEATCYVQRPQTKSLIKKHIDAYLKKGTLRSFVGIFIDTTTLADQASEALLSYLADTENETYVAKVILNKVNDLLARKPSEIIGLLGDYKANLVLETGIDLLITKVSQGKLFSKELIINLLGSEQVTYSLKRYLLKLLAQIRPLKLTSLYNYLDAKKWATIEDKLLCLYIDKAPAFIENIVSEFKLTQVIQDKINSFDLAELEEMLFGLAKKELAAITWLGGLLGFLMGLITPLLSIFLD